jgi:hypothetical protein
LYAHPDLLDAGRRKPEGVHIGGEENVKVQRLRLVSAGAALVLALLMLSGCGHSSHHHHVVVHHHVVHHHVVHHHVRHH